MPSRPRQVNPPPVDRIPQDILDRNQGVEENEPVVNLQCPICLVTLRNVSLLCETLSVIKYQLPFANHFIRNLVACYIVITNLPVSSLTLI